ncbi:MAG TPA: polysaccharide biosynthesis/export family protein [Stellaceae bacterium]|jgi:polysaccharide export outer membrane protein
MSKAAATWTAVVALVAGVVFLPAGSSKADGFQPQNSSFQSTSQFAPVGSPASPGVQSAAIPQFSSTVPSTSIVRPDYVIGPDDTVSVDVFGVPALSGTVQVDSEGKVLLPLLGEVPAAGRSVGQLSKQIAAAYGASYVRDPKVTVSVKDSASQKVTVDGAVLQPGIYPITTRTTLMQAIALAKGPDPKLASDKVAIFRSVGQQRSEAVFDLGEIRDGKSMDPQVQPNDVVVVDTSGMRRFLQDISPIAPFAALGAVF